LIILSLDTLSVGYFDLDILVQGIFSLDILS